MCPCGQRRQNAPASKLSDPTTATLFDSPIGPSKCEYLLDRDGLREVARLVDVQALRVGEAHREDVQRNDREQRFEEGTCERDAEHLVGKREDSGVALFGDRDDAGAPGADLLDVGDDLRVQQRRFAGRRDDHEDGLPGLDQGDRSVLQLAGGETLGMDVGDLLELERPLEGDRETDVATEEEHRAGVGHPAGELLDVSLLLGEDACDLGGNRLEFARVVGERDIRHRSADRGDMQRQQIQRGDLRNEGLGRGDCHLGSGVRVDDGVGFARDRRALRVADREGLRARFARELHGHEGVHGLAGLADRHDERVRADDRVTVAELVGEFDVAGDACPLLDGVLADHARVRGRAAGHDDDPVDAREKAVETLEFGDLDPAVTDASAQRVGDGIRLFGNLLRHERRPAALVCGAGIPLDLERLDLDHVAVEVRDRDGVGRDRDDLVLTDREGVAGVLDERGDVGPEEVLALAEADHQRRIAPRTDDDAGAVLVHREQGERTLETGCHRAERRGEISTGCLVFAPEQDRGHFGVGLAQERVAVAEELGLQLGEVLDDAVVDDGELVIIGQVRVGIRVGRAAVGGPTGVADARRAVRHGVGFQIIAQDGELARALAHVHVARVIDDGDPGGVVAAVFQTRETLEEDLLAGASSDISDDSAHGPIVDGARPDRILVRACGGAPSRRCGRRLCAAPDSRGAGWASHSRRGSAG